MPISILPSSFMPAMLPDHIAGIQFPDRSIVGVGRKYVDLCSSIRETPRPFLWAAYSTYLGNIISPYVKIKDIPTSEPRLFTAVLGKSSWARKSSGNNLTEAFFQDVGSYFGGTGGLPRPQRTIDGFGSSEGLLKNLKEPVPTVLLLDELDVLAKKTTADGSIGISALNTLFEKHKFEYSLSRSECKASGVRLSMLAASTIDSFLSTWSGEHADAGFFSRLFIVCSESHRTHPFPQEPPEGEWEEMKAHTVLLVQEARDGKFMNLEWADGAKSRWVKFYESCGEGFEWNRLDTYGLRLISLQCVLKSETTISEETVNEVVDILNYEADVRREFRPVVSETIEGKVQQRIISALDGGSLSYRDIYKKVHAERVGTRVFAASIAGLEELEIIIKTDEEKSLAGQMRAPRYILNPHVSPKVSPLRGGDRNPSSLIN